MDEYLATLISAPSNGADDKLRVGHINIRLLTKLTCPQGLVSRAQLALFCAPDGTPFKWRIISRMVMASAVARVLGGEKTLGKRVSSQQDLISAVRRGLRASVVDAIIEELGMPRSEVLPRLRLAKRTMERRKTTGRLLPGESERIYRLAKVLAFAETVLGSRDKARQWLNTPNRALGSLSPLALLETEAGADEVINVLGRIEFGVYS